MDGARMSELLAYCRIDEPSAADRVLLQRFYRSAVAMLAKAGVDGAVLTGADLDQYHELIDRLVLDKWEHRGSQSAGVTLIENPAFRRELNQLKVSAALGTGVADT